jgi:hypothetical protein
MERSSNDYSESLIQTNTINRYLTLISSSLLAGGIAYQLSGNNKGTEAWLFRDDIGAPDGIKGYEEQVNSVGMHHGHTHFPADNLFNTWNSAT